MIRELGDYFVGLKDFDQVLALFKYGISRYPSSTEAFNGLAYGYEQSGQYQSALVQVNKALALASKDHNGYQVFVNRRERLTKLIKQTPPPD